MEQTECSETSAYKIQTSENYPEENLQQPGTPSPSDLVSHTQTVRLELAVTLSQHLHLQTHNALKLVNKAIYYELK